MFIYILLMVYQPHLHQNLPISPMNHHYSPLTMDHQVFHQVRAARGCLQFAKRQMPQTVWRAQWTATMVVFFKCLFDIFGISFLGLICDISYISNNLMFGFVWGYCHLWPCWPYWRIWCESGFFLVPSQVQSLKWGIPLGQCYRLSVDIPKVQILVLCGLVPSYVLSGWSGCNCSQVSLAVNSFAQDIHSIIAYNIV